MHAMPDPTPPPDAAAATPLFKQVTCLPPPKHAFGPIIDVPATDDRPQQKERTCLVCGIVRITVLEGEGRREWRWPGMSAQVADDFRPECVPVLTDRGCRP